MKPNAMQTTAGFVRLITALALLTAITWQVSDRLANNVFRPGEYFAYFTIQTSMIAAVALTVAGIRSLKGLEETKLLNRVRLSVVSYAVVVGVVYNALLRGLPGAAEDGNYVWPVIPNEILHVWAPIVIFLEFAIFRVTNRATIKQIFWVLLFPLAWLIFSILRGFATDWWAYWFLNPNDPGGITQMVTYIFGIMFFLLVAASAAVGASQIAKARS